MQSINPQEKHIQINDLNINYKTIGNGKIPIVLLHGWGLPSDKYLELARWLHNPKLSDSETGLWSQNAEHKKSQSDNAEMLHSPNGTMEPAISQFKIIIPDLPGFGKSDEPNENWGLGDYVEFVDKFIKSATQERGFELVKNILNKSSLKNIINGGFGSVSSVRTEERKNPVLIGHSLGGKIAIRYAIKYPEKIDKLILTGAAGIKSKLTVKQKIFSILGKTGKIIFSFPIINNFQKPIHKIFSKLARSRKKDYYSASLRMKEIMKNILAEDLVDCLNKIKKPTMLVWGREDKTTPLSDGEIMNEKIGNSELTIIDSANHSLPYQKPEEFSKIVEEFIKK